MGVILHQPSVLGFDDFIRKRLADEREAGREVVPTVHDLVAQGRVDWRCVVDLHSRVALAGFVVV